MKPTNVIDMAAWRAAHAPASVAAALNMKEELLKMLMSLTPEQERKLGIYSRPNKA